MLSNPQLINEDFVNATSKKELLEIIHNKNIIIDDVLETVNYENEKRLLQIELVKLQQWIKKYNKRVAVIFEGAARPGI